MTEHGGLQRVEKIARGVGTQRAYIPRSDQIDEFNPMDALDEFSIKASRRTALRMPGSGKVCRSNDASAVASCRASLASFALTNAP